MSNRYLVTGCAGFIGSKVAELLLDAGHAVVGVDSVNDAYDPRLKKWRLDRLLPQADFRFQHLDITDFEAMEQLFASDSGADRTPPYSAVINLAARAGVRASVDDPWVYYRANCEGTLNLLELCRRYGVEKFVLASTSSLYGAHNPIPYREDADTNRPLSPYAASKKGAEATAYTYHHLHGIDVTVFRYFTVYGPAGRPDMSVFRFVRRIAEGEPIIVFGDGTQQRDFTYIDDIARGTVAGLAPFGYEVINLGGDRPVRLSTIIDQIGELLDRQPVIEYQPAHPADVDATWADVAKAGKLLNWSPQVPIEEGLRLSVDWYRQNRDTILPLELGDR
ncbi:MAG: GDP-mannose 4,6-dehydratase [Planctomycetes bacterium]|nr:GDP-mannose 4,6-dehydratase [Planctomycetota bacterium]